MQKAWNFYPYDIQGTLYNIFVCTKNWRDVVHCYFEHQSFFLLFLVFHVNNETSASEAIKGKVSCEIFLSDYFMKYLVNVNLTVYLTPKTAGGGGRGGQVDLLPVFFWKIYLLKKGWNPGFLWLLILSYRTSFLKISLKFLKSFKDMENFSVNISYFHQFSSIFQIFWHFLVTTKLMTSTYNRWCQDFFTFNIL